MLSGGCFCGCVRYTTTGTPFAATICHCSICRRTSGAPFVAWFTVPADTFELITGQAARFASSNHAQRTFCPRCGTQLTFQSNRWPNEIDVTICSLDAPDEVPPTCHTYTSSKLAWVRLADNLPAYREARESAPGGA